MEVRIKMKYENILKESSKTNEGNAGRKDRKMEKSTVTRQRYTKIIKQITTGETKQYEKEPTKQI